MIIVIKRKKFELLDEVFYTINEFIEALHIIETTGSNDKIM